VAVSVVAVAGPPCPESMTTTSTTATSTATPTAIAERKLISSIRVWINARIRSPRLTE
jgi:hypothetical protein